MSFLNSNIPYNPSGYGTSSYNPTGYGTNNYMYGNPQVQQATQYGTNQQYVVPQPNQYGATEPQSAIMVHGIEGARNYHVPKNSLVPLFDDEEDIFYIKTTDPDGMHQRIKKYRFYEEFDGDVLGSSSNLIEQKDMNYGDSANNMQEINSIKKSIDDLTGQINALVELQLEQSSADGQDKTTKTTTTKRTSNNK